MIASHHLFTRVTEVSNVDLIHQPKIKHGILLEYRAIFFVPIPYSKASFGYAKTHLNFITIIFILINKL